MRRPLEAACALADQAVKWARGLAHIGTFAEFDAAAPDGFGVGIIDATTHSEAQVDHP